MNMMNAKEQILEFWFGESNDAAIAAAEKSALWWKKQVSTDQLIKSRFESTVQAAAAGELDHWRGSAKGVLALIILLDQFPRNIYRDTPAAFAFDPLARAACLEGLERGDDRQLNPIERVFFYLPLEHAEDKRLQAQSVELFRKLVSDDGSDKSLGLNGYLDFAIKHQVIIAQFGRFPHRNKILQRDSTPAELAFLQQPGSSF